MALTATEARAQLNPTRVSIVQVGSAPVVGSVPVTCTNCAESGSSTFTLVGVTTSTFAGVAQPVYQVGSTTGVVTLLNGVTVYGTLSVTQSGTWSVQVGTSSFAGVGTFTVTSGSGTYTVTPGTGTFSVTGDVSVSNFPASFAVTGTVLTDGSAHTQPVSGTFWQAVQPISGSVSVNNQTSTSSLVGVSTITFAGVAQPVSGTVSVDNFPATQPVSGSVSVNNFTSTVSIVGTPNVSVTNTPNVAVTNTPTVTVGNASLSVTQGGAFAVSVNNATSTMSIVNVPQVYQSTSGVNASTVTAVISGVVPVSGSFWQATQPISAATLPLPTGASTAAKQPALGTAGTASADVITVQGKAGMTAVVVDGSAVTQPVSGSVSAAVTGTVSVNNFTSTVSIVGIPVVSVNNLTSTVAFVTPPQMYQSTAGVYASTVTAVISGVVPVSGTFWQATQPISAAALPLPSGAATAAKQPALGTSGTASADVITVQGVASMTPLLVNGSGVTQPVSGSVSVNNFTSTVSVVNWTSTVSFSVPQQVWQSTSGVYGSTVSAMIINTPSVAQSGTWTVQPGNTANTTAWKVDGSAVTQPISAAALPLPTGASTAAKQPALGTAGTSSADVITVQGRAAMTPLLVDGSGVTQPVSGTISCSNCTPGGGVATTTVTFNGITQPVYLTNATSTVSFVTPPQMFQSTAGVYASTVTAVINGVVPVSGTFWQATQPISGSVSVNNHTSTVAVVGTVTVDGSGVTQPVSAAALPLPTGASTAAKQPALGTAGTSSSDVITVQGRAAMTPLLTDGSAVTQPISGSLTNVSGTISLPTGAATAAKQPALGTAGTSSADVITVQGRAAMTPLLVDGSAVTQPISGSLTNIAGTISLPTGASTAAKQPALGTAGTSSADVITVQGRAAMTPLLTDGSAVTQPVVVNNFTSTRSIVGTVTGLAGQSASGSATWTAATAIDTALTIAVSSYSGVSFSFKNSGDLLNGCLKFEVSNDGGTNWYSVRAGRIDSATSESYFELSQTSLPQMWQLNTAGFTNFRIRLSKLIVSASDGTSSVALVAQAIAATPQSPVTVTQSAGASAQVTPLAYDPTTPYQRPYLLVQDQKGRGDQEMLDQDRRDMAEISNQNQQ